MNGLLLEDVIIDDKFEILEETVKGEPRLIYRGVLARANYANKNKRIYPYGIMESAIKRIDKVVKDRGFIGSCDHPLDPAVKVRDISHVVTDIKLLEDGTVIGELEPILGTPNGDHLKALMKARIKLGVSTRGTGTVKPYKGPLGEGLVEVNSDFNLLAVDVVYNPSNDAWPQIIAESTNHIYLGNTINFKRVWLDVFGA